MIKHIHPGKRFIIVILSLFIIFAGTPGLWAEETKPATEAPKPATEASKPAAEAAKPTEEEKPTGRS